MEPLIIDRRAIDPALRVGEWRAPDGWMLRRGEWPQPSGGRVRGSLLYAAGRGDFIEKYLEPLGQWHARGWNVTAFDWRGQGGSKGGLANGNDVPFDQMVEDLAALIADWRAAAPGPHVVIGHSMGGHLLLRVLVEHRPAIDAAVLTAPMIRVNSAPIPEWLAGTVASLACRLGLASKPLPGAPSLSPEYGSARQRALTACPDRYEDEQYWWRKVPAYAPAPPTWGWIRAAARSAGAFSREKLAQVDLPVLIVGAANDRLVSVKAIRRIAGLLPRAELALLDGAHEVLRECEPVRGEAMARIDAFFDRHAR